MPRITIAIPDDLLADAKACAAKAGVSVSEIVGHMRNERAAMAELHLDDEEALSVLQKNFSEMLDRFGKIADPSSKKGG